MKKLKRNLGKLIDVVIDYVLHEDILSKKAKKQIGKYFDSYLTDNKILMFLNSLHEIKKNLKEDIEFTYICDPASNSYQEIALCYPGIYAIAIYRVANELYKMDEGVIARMFSEYAHSKTGIDIHPGAKIDVPFFIDHGTGIVIGQTAVIGKYVRIYQGVTLGALSLEDAHKVRNLKRHPTIEDNVIIYANATILGGNTIIKSNSIIGGNAFITKSIEKNSKVTTKCKE